MTGVAGYILPSNQDEQISPRSALSNRNNATYLLFLRELQQHVPVTQATILLDDAHCLKAAVSRLGSDLDASL